MAAISAQFGAFTKVAAAPAAGRRAPGRSSSSLTVSMAAPKRSAGITLGGVADNCAKVGMAAGAAYLASPLAALADDGSMTLAVGAGGVMLGLAGLLVATDPSKRREAMATETGGDEMESVRKYFNTEGFNRWEKIYGETDEVNKVQLDIRTGHAQTVDKVLKWVDEEGGVDGISVADCGCGTGSLSIPLALRGAEIYASDISLSMANEAAQRYEAEASTAEKKPKVGPKFEEKDLESVSGKYHTVACLDVMIHYPQDKADGMVKHLASLADERVILSFAPYTVPLYLLKRVGELFPGPSKATRAYLHKESDVEKALNEAGWKVVKREMTSTQFYFSRLLEAVRA